MTRRAAALTAAAALLFGAHAAGAPTWSPHVQISSGDRAVGPELAMNRVGDALIVWDQEVGSDCTRDPASTFCVHIVQLAARTFGSEAWPPPAELSRPGVDSRPTAGIGGSGDAAVAWVHDIGRDRVLQATSRRGRSGTWPEPNDLSEAVLQIRDHAIAVDDAGNVVAVWAERAESTFAVNAIVRPAASGVWGAPVRLSSIATATAGPSLAVAGNGDAIVAWVEGGSLVRVSRGNAGSGAWTPPTNVSRSTWPVAGRPDVALNASGDAAVAWAQRAAGETSQRAQVSYRPHGASWEPPRSLRPPYPDGVQAEPAIALDGTGNSVVIWLSSGGVAAAARAGQSGSWVDPLLVASSQERARDTQLALDPAGNAVAAWRNDEKGSVRTALRPGASGVWQPPSTISPTGVAPRLALDAGGSGIAVWNASSGAGIVVVTSSLDGSGPVVESLRAPKRAAVGAPVMLGATSSPWAAPLAGPLRWRFGDGASGTGPRVTHAYRRAGRFAISVTQADAAGVMSTRRATIVVGAPRNSVRPSILGTVRFGSLLTCSPGRWTGARPITFAYQWLRDGYAIPGATAPHYRVRVRDLAEFLACRVRATNALGSTRVLTRRVRVSVGT